MEFLLILVPIAFIAWLVIGNVVNDRQEAKRNQEEQKPSDSKVNTNVTIGGGGADNACDSDSEW
jgi:hypothetical protein